MMYHLFLVVVALLISALLYAIFIFIKKQKAKWTEQRNLKIGDVVMLDKNFRRQYPHLPVNNPLTVIEVEKSKVIVRYIHFKEITMHQETLNRNAVRKVS